MNEYNDAQMELMKAAIAVTEAEEQLIIAKEDARPLIVTEAETILLEASTTLFQAARAYTRRWREVRVTDQKKLANADTEELPSLFDRGQTIPD